MKILAAFALIPALIGPLPQDQRSITIALCSGGTATIPLGGKERERQRECDREGCHAGSCRQKSKSVKS